MKNYCLIFAAVLTLFAFSCKGLPDNNDDLPDVSSSAAVVDESPEVLQDSAVAEDQPDDSVDNSELAQTEDGTEDDVETLTSGEDESTPETELVSTDTVEENFDTPEEPQTAESIQEDPPEQLSSLSEQQPSPEPQPPVQQAEPPVVAAPPIVQIPSPAPEPQPQVQQSTPPAVQTPPVQQPSQPPVQQSSPPPPPQTLGPAEEKPSQQQDRITAEPQGNISTAETPFQSVSVPQQDDEIKFSRVVRATVGQIIEIPFRGTGWVYLGELASRRGIVYNSRRLDTDGQSFIFTAEEAGTYALKFFRQDFLRDYILNDHVQVIVGEAPSASAAGWFNPPVDRGRVVAEPRWPSSLEEAEILRGGSGVSSAPPSAESTQTPTPPAVQSVSPAQETSVQETPSSQETSSSGISSLFTQPSDTQPASSLSPPAATERQDIPQGDVLLQSAKETFDGGNAAGAIALLDQFREYYPSGSDELYWLYGQFYEANTPSRNILLSLDYYRRLVNEYPQSGRFNDARNRIAYLERFYIHIR